MPRFAASNRRVTDGLVLKQLRALRIDEQSVEFSQDYAHRGLGKGYSPFAKWYRNLNGPERWMVISGLPMTDCDGDPCTPGWLAQGASGRFVAKNNQYRALIRGKDVALTVRNDDPFGRKKGATLSYSPRLFVGGVEIPAAAPVLLPVDPWNPNYTQNVLEWDYGVCKRKLRTVEGRVHGYWVFPANPGGDVLIRYGQTGDYRLKLGQYRQNEDEEFIPASVFAAATYPFEVSDSATYYPDANEETTSVDGVTWDSGNNAAWATVIAEPGNASEDNLLTDWHCFIWSTTTSNQWDGLGRSCLLFDSAGLPDEANISATTLSVYGDGKGDNLSITPNVNVYTSAPASNTALAGGDFDSFGSTAQSDTAITYAGWSTTGYNDFTFNATGRGNISKVSVSKFGLRNANFDVAGSAPAWSSNVYSYLEGYLSEQGTGYKPKLVVTYTTPTDYPRTASVARGLSV